ncbi:MAG: HNH endonuclease [Lachnospiraceae bacterium]|nr:HNH endonuclease [Lachnospiraceae bacterium]
MAKDWAKSFYNSTEWKRMRKSILSRDKYRCQSKGCFSSAEEVHHIIELNESNIKDKNVSLNPKNLISLCSDCHKRITKEQKRIERGGKPLPPALVFDENGQPSLLPEVLPPGG